MVLFLVGKLYLMFFVQINGSDFGDNGERRSIGLRDDADVVLLRLEVSERDRDISHGNYGYCLHIAISSHLLLSMGRYALWTGCRWTWSRVWWRLSVAQVKILDDKNNKFVNNSNKNVWLGLVNKKCPIGFCLGHQESWFC